MNDLINLLVTPALAATTGAASNAPPQSGAPFFIILGVMILFMYFAAWRPQGKRAREQRNLLNSLAEGDEVITAGGILGTIKKISDPYMTLALTEGVHVTVTKSSVVSLLPKGTLKLV